jgi:peptide subunit release factor 1 (eRF1)
MLTPNARRMKKHQLLRLLDELNTSSTTGITIYLPHCMPLPEIEKTLSVVLKQEPALPDITNEVARSSTGAVIFWGEQHHYLITPPFPINENLIIQEYDADILRSLMNRKLTLAIVLVRMGAYAIGVFHNDRLTASKVGTGLVHSRHKKGGSSAHRYERHRDKQIELFFSHVCIHTHEIVEPYLTQIDHLYYGGESFTIRSFREQCHYLKKLDNHTMALLLNIRELKQTSLEAALAEIWSSKVIHWQQD